MTRLLLAAATAVLAITPSAQAGSSACDGRSCITYVGEKVCGDDGCGPVARCHYWTDYPLCIY
jgi:hypothetical protein